MSTEAIRAIYRERLKVGSTVYLVDGETVLGNGPMTVKKGTVTSTTTPGDGARHYPMVALWDNVYEDPDGLGINVAKSPRALLTEQEVRDALLKDAGPLGEDRRSVDELVADPLTCQELTAVIGALIINRLVLDELRNPGNPEY